MRAIFAEKGSIFQCPATGAQYQYYGPVAKSKDRYVLFNLDTSTRLIVSGTAFRWLYQMKIRNEPNHCL